VGVNNLQLCDGDNNVIAECKAGDDSTTLIFSGEDTSLTDNVKYHVKKKSGGSNCTDLSAGDFKLTISLETSTITLTVKAGAAEI